METRKTLCLVMIVRNESKVIERCLNRVKDHIDYWVIVDTGSDDNTPELIKNTLAHVPGELHHRPWVNFGANRTESLRLAKGKADYLLLCDADEQIVFSDKFDPAALTKEAYLLQYLGGNAYSVPYLIRSDIDWKYVGVTHEYLDSHQPYQREKLSTISIIDLKDGGFKQDKYERDIRLLEQGLIEEPNNSRYKFYLANSYRDIANYEKAAEWYKHRISDQGWKEEVTVAYENLGGCYDLLGKSAEALHYWLLGYDYNPTRMECLFNAIRLLRKQGKHHLAYQLCLRAKKIPFPKNDILFVKADVYNYLIDFELAICAYYSKNFKLGYNACKHVLRAIPNNDTLIKIILEYLRYYKEEAKYDFSYNIKPIINIIENFLNRQKPLDNHFYETVEYLKKLL